MMASSVHTVSQCSSYVSFKCCKSKSFIHYVCIKCSNVFHKSCLHRYKKQISFVKENKVICCSDSEDSSYTFDDEKSVLEKTINELTDDSDMKTQYIKKLKNEHEIFIKDALKVEEEMNELLKKKDEFINKLTKEIDMLNKKYVKDTKSTKTIAIQTDNQVKTLPIDLNGKYSISVSEGPTTVKFAQTHTKTNKDKFFINNTENKQKPGIDSIPIAIQSGTKNLNTELSGSTEVHNLKPFKKETKKQILLLTDDANITWKVRKLLDLSKYAVTTVRKPGARLNQVMENIDALSKNFTLQDYIIILGGRNDIDKNNTPSFRLICNKLKLCSHTNILFASIPYCKNATQKNKHIFKFNCKLNDFLCKFNSYTQGHVKYIEINNDGTVNPKTTRVVSHIIEAILSNKNSHKNLIFINTVDHIDDAIRIQEETALNQSKSDVIEIIEIQDKSSSFLYPQLSEISFLN